MTTYNTQYHQLNTHKKMNKVSFELIKIAPFLIPIPLFMIFYGINGFIQKSQSESVANLNSFSYSLVNDFSLHAMIVGGAFAITCLIWLADQAQYRSH